MLSSVTSNLLSWVPSWRSGVELQSGVSRIQDCGRALQSDIEMDTERPEDPHKKIRALTRFEEMLRDAWTPELIQEHLPRRQSRLWLACVSKAGYRAVMPSVLPMAGSHLARMRKPGYDVSKITSLRGLNCTHFRDFREAFPQIVSLRTVELASSGTSVFGNPRQDTLLITRSPVSGPSVTFHDNSRHRTRLDAASSDLSHHRRLYGDFGGLGDLIPDLSSMVPLTISYVLDLTPNERYPNGDFNPSASLGPVAPGYMLPVPDGTQTQVRSIVCTPAGRRRAREHGVTNVSLTNDIGAAISQLPVGHRDLDDVFVPMLPSDVQSMKDLAHTLNDHGARLQHLNLASPHNCGRNNAESAASLSEVIELGGPIWQVSASRLTLPVSRLDLGSSSTYPSVASCTEVITLVLPTDQRPPSIQSLSRDLARIDTEASFRLSYTGAERDEEEFMSYNPELAASVRSHRVESRFTGHPDVCS